MIHNIEKTTAKIPKIKLQIEYGLVIVLATKIINPKIPKIKQIIVNINKRKLSYILLLILMKPNIPVINKNTPIIHIQKILNIKPTFSSTKPAINKIIYAIPTKDNNK